MTNEEIAETITEFMDGEVRDLGNIDWKEVLQIVESNIREQLQAKYDEEN